MNMQLDLGERTQGVRQRLYDTRGQSASPAKHYDQRQHPAAAVVTASMRKPAILKRSPNHHQYSISAVPANQR